MSEYILKFANITEADKKIVGGKALNLALMKKSNFNVPDGFSVTTNAYRAFLEHNNLTRLLSDIMITKEESAELREQIKASKIPDHVFALIKTEIGNFPEDSFFAVRSSSVDEDTPNFSFAGQQDTFLNIKGDDELKKAILGCFASLFTDRVIYYRIQNGVKTAEMAVIIQKMIPAHISGVMFTSDPATGSRDVIAIDASFGLGTSVVSGLVSPDMFKIDKNNLTVSKIINEKKKAVLPFSEGGVTEISIPPDHMADPAISDETAKKLAEKGMKLEALFGCPQDIEWCLDSDDISIVQSRPITTLFPTPEHSSADKGMRTYFSFSHGQMMTDPISPMGISILKMIVPANLKARSEDDCKYLYPAGGRLYIDISEILKSPFMGGKIPSFVENINVLMGKALKNLTLREDFNKKTRGVKNGFPKLFFYLFSACFGVVANYNSRDTEGMLGRINNLTRLTISDLKNEIEATSLGTRKLEIAKRKINLDNVIHQLLPLFVPGVMSFKKLLSLENKYLGHTKYTNTIVAGLEGNITSRIGIMIGDMADIVRKSDTLKKEFCDTNYKTLQARINELSDCQDFQKLYSDFMKIYGMRCAKEIDISVDRWQENPEYIAKAVMTIVNTARHNAHNEEAEKNKAAAKKAENAFISSVKEAKGSAAARKIKRLVGTCKNMLPAREHPKYLIVNLLMIFKERILEEALKLVEAGILETKNDVFYCNYYEFFEAVKKGSDLKEIVKIRKEEYEKYKRLTPPYVMTSEGEAVIASYERIGRNDKNRLYGVAASPGVIEGIAKVVTDPNREVVNKGEILIAKFTDPGWTPLFLNAAGLVMELGGILTHGTIIAREYGMPTVVGVENAVSKIKTGDKIRVDGSGGYIEFLKEVPDVKEN